MRPLALLAFASCTLQVPVYWVDAREDYSWQRIDDACAWWGLECFEADDADGSLMVILSESGAYDESLDRAIGGHVVSDHVCSPAVFASDNGADLEHEIGHAFGLKHSDDPANLMWWQDSQVDDEITERQLRRVHRRVDLLAGCLP